MKKVFMFFLAVLLLASSSVAFASVEFKYKGSDTYYFRRWTPYATYSEGKDWSLTWKTHNLRPNRRAVVRVHAGYQAASPLYVYNHPSTTPHDYNPGFGYGQEWVELRGRLDNRDGDQAPLDVKGFFYE